MKIAAAILLAILSTMIQPGTFNESRTYDEDAVWYEMATAPSYVPENEKYIHIGGGYFSVFDCSKGTTMDNRRGKPGPEDGTIIFRLSELGWESRFVYLPSGVLEINYTDGRSCNAEMERLDYVEDPETGRTLYRLTARMPEGRIVLLSDAPGSDTERYPVLLGRMLIITEDRISITDFRISGRDEYAAERHLNRVLFIVSDFS